MKEPPAVGEFVMLKSGGPAMTVTEVSADGESLCEWVRGGEVDAAYFAPEVLLRLCPVVEVSIKDPDFHAAGERMAAKRKSVRGEPCRSDMTPFPRRELTTEEKAVLLKRNGGRVPNGGFCVGDLPYTCPDCGGEHPCHDAACAAVDRWARGEPAFPDSASCPAPHVAGGK